MTVIATFDFPDYPMILSDMLLSGEQVDGKRVAIPTIGEVSNFFPDGSGWTITGLTQKIAIVSDECVVAWAGSWIAARMAISELKDIADEQLLTPETVTHFFQNLDEGIKALGLSIVGLLWTHDGFFKISFNAELDYKTNDKVSVSSAGSGADYLRVFLETSRRGERIGGTNPNVHPAQLAYETGLQIGACFLRSENTLGDPLRLYFGGGYEVAVFNGERFTKDRGITYVLWDWRGADQGHLPFPCLIIVYEYKGDVLYVHSQEFKPKAEKLGFDIGAIHIGTIGPIYRRIPLPDNLTPASISKQSPWICHAFIGMSPDGTIRRAALVDRLKHDGTDKLSFETNQGVIIKINAKKEFWRDLDKMLTFV